MIVCKKSSIYNEIIERLILIFAKQLNHEIEMIAQEKIAEIVNKIALGFNPDKIILFGSYAKGNPTEDSDLDLLIIKSSDLTRPQRVMQVRKMLYGALVPIDILVYTPAEIASSIENKFSLVFEVLNTGKTLYERAS